MRTVRFVGWRVGLNKVQLVHTIRAHSDLDLFDA